MDTGQLSHWHHFPDLWVIADSDGRERLEKALDSGRWIEPHAHSWKSSSFLPPHPFPLSPNRVT